MHLTSSYIFALNEASFCCCNLVHPQSPSQVSTVFEWQKKSLRNCHKVLPMASPLGFCLFVATWHSLNRGQLTHLDAKQSRAFVTTWIPSPRTMFYGFAFCWYFTEGTLIAALLRFVMSNDAVHFSHRESCSYPWAPPNAANSYFYARNAPICWENTLAMILHNIIVYLCVFLNDEEWGYHEKRQTRVATDTNTRCKAIPCIGTLIRFVTAKAR